MVDLRKIVIIFIIAALFTILVNTTIEAVYPSPKHENFCNEPSMYNPVMPAIVKSGDKLDCPAFKDALQAEKDSCTKQKGYVQYGYDAYGCPTAWKCNTCENKFMEQNKKYNLFVFIISALFALIAISVGLYLPVEKNRLHEWIATGFLLGGLITLFVGTARGFESLGRFVKPTVIALELALVIYIAYKKLGEKGEKKK